ncbi:MAG: SPASM domain-containing protein [Chryseobacterium sp.]|uniref:radical SAM/SPASM domain-containing protein n=1 Tax=Chryseobacterium sp. TaxID=1871047 RepID=UPI0025BC8C22|nr:radical SAM protein [Chryseobacterium sp.]MCJ7932652.1 SPASM domain-containing protein [Chryseobacterium sp.]
MQFKLSKYKIIVADEDILGDSAILYSTRTGISIEMPKKTLDSVLALDLKNIPAQILAQIIQMEIYVPSDEVEMTEILTSNKLGVTDIDSGTLTYVIQPSGNCQLGCHYCGQLHTKKSMSQEILDLSYERVKNKLQEQKETIRRMHITWYGGEPLTGLSALSQLSTKLIDLARSNNLEYTSNIITNALNLKYSLFEKLVREFRITEYQITVDGLSEFHDKRRMLKNGEKSFDIIMNNIETIVASQLYQDKRALINFRCNVDSENKDNVLALIDYLHDKGILKYVSFYIAAIHDWGDNKATIKGISKQEFADFEIDVYLKLHEYGCLKHTVVVPERVRKPCMVVSKTSEVFDAFGNVSTCWEVPYTPYYDDSKYYSGNLLKSKDIDTTNAHMRNWFDEIPTNDSWCKDCTFLPLCGGACPKDWAEGTPACPSFKFNIEDRLLLQRYINNN